MEKQRVKKPNKPKVKKTESQVEADRFDKDDFDFHVFIAVSYTMYFVWFQVRFEDDDLNRLLAEIEAYREFE